MTTDASKPKAGIKTTEFYGKLIIQLSLILNMIFDLGVEIDDKTALTIVGGLEAIYNVVRGITKAGPKVVHSTLATGDTNVSNGLNPGN